MPVHDWTKVDAGMFHDFHNEWLVSIKHALNHGILPPEYYAVNDQHAGEFIPDVLTLGAVVRAERESSRTNGATLLSKPNRRASAIAEFGVRRRKRKMVTIRHVSNDEVVAFVEVVSPGNKDSRRSIRAFVDKMAGLLEQGIHALVVDVFPPGRRDLNGIHGAVWEESHVRPTDCPSANR